MNRLLSKEYELFREKAARFVREEIDPHAQEWNKACQLPRECWVKMGEWGLLGPSFDERYGGMGLDLMYLLILAEEFGRSRARGLAWMVLSGIGIAARYLLDGSEEIRMKHLAKCISGEAICAIAITEPDAGSDAASIKTRAERDEDYYIVNGQKTFITNGCKADLIMTAVKTDVDVSPAYKGVSVILIEADTPGFSRGQKFEKMGTEISDTAELFFQDCRVPASNLLGKENGGFKTIMQHLAWERLLGAALYVTACEEMLKYTRDFCHKHKVCGRSVFSFQDNRHRFVDMSAEVALAKNFYKYCCECYLSGEKIDTEISMIKFLASELANKIAADCLSLTGVYSKENVICQWLTDVRVYNIGAGTTEVMKEIIAGQMGLG